jgi:predicted transcriptional regulator of viral defense system
MNASEALGRLRALRVAVVTTSDASAALGLRVDAASQTLRRLARAGLVIPVRRGLWAFPEQPDRLLLAEYVTAPYPAYVSLQTALYLHGVVEQIPAVTYLVSLGRSARVRTPIGAYGIHHVAPELFGGFEQDPRTGVKLARPEKALFDVVYLSGTSSRLFRSLPELTLGPNVRIGRARAWVGRIGSRRLRSMTEARLEALFASAKGAVHDAPRVPRVAPM